MTDTSEDLRLKVAISCRILGMLGLVRDSTGHVSARIPGTDEMWIRCRGGDEYGLLFTGLHNVRRVNFDGEGPGLGDKHASPNETAIHGEIYRAHPEVQAVVHAHPYYALMCGVTNMEFRPVFAAYDPSSLDIVLKGVPVFPRSVTVTNKQLAADMLAAMGDRDVLLMRGHGISVTASTVEAATLLAIRFDRLSQIMWELALSGRDAPNISDEDMARYQRRGQDVSHAGGPAPLGSAEMGGRLPATTPMALNRPRSGWAALEGVETWGWKHYVRLLQVRNIGLPDDTWG